MNPGPSSLGSTPLSVNSISSNKLDPKTTTMLKEKLAEHSNRCCFYQGPIPLGYPLGCLLFYVSAFSLAVSPIRMGMPQMDSGLSERDPAPPHRLERLDKPDTGSEPRSLILLQSCSTRKANHTVATPGIGWPKGCLLLSVAPPTSSAFPTPSIFLLLLSTASCTLPQTTLPSFSDFWAWERKWNFREARRLSPSSLQEGAQCSPTEDGAGSCRPPREALPEAETKMPSLLFVFPRARAG